MQKNIIHKLFMTHSEGWRPLALATILFLAAHIHCHAQTPTVQFTTTDTAVCDISSVTLHFAVQGLPQTGKFVVAYRDHVGTLQNREIPVVNIKRNQLDVQIDNTTDFVPNIESGHTELNYEIEKAYVSMSDLAEDRINFEIGEKKTLKWHLYGTPRKDLPPSDARSIAIYNKDINCGFDIELQANPRWKDNSKYTWTVASDQFVIDNDGSPNAMMRYVGSEKFQKTTVNIRLTQEVGGLCKTYLTSSVTLLGEPEATLARTDASGADAPVMICSTIPSKEDSHRRFDGTINIKGEYPFVAKLSTGESYNIAKEGVFSFEDAHTDMATPVTLTEVTDRNGCPATENYIHGQITVLDRKPHPTFEHDSVHTDQKTLSVEVIPTSAGHAFEWGLVPTNRTLDTQISGYINQAEISSRLNGTFAYYVIETDEAADYAACPSDTTVLMATFATPIRYPNGISPNGDGRNDYLVIEGLPERNQISIMDSRGKIVFEKTDYRNDWDAEGLPDGYYVFIFKGEGVKTIKETLAIKRQSND